MKTKEVLLLLLFVLISVRPAWGATGKQPITVNGDTVEFKSDGQEVVAEGHVEITYQQSTITCDKVRVFINEKLIIADGSVKFKKESGEELSGETIVYDFESHTGTIVEADVRMSPYYGSCGLMEKLSDEEFLLNDSVLSTCDLPHPHYSLTCRSAQMQPGRLLTAKGVKLSIADIPILYLPQYTQRLTDERPRFTIVPGHDDDLGTYLLGSWRYYLNENARGLLHVDWYQDKGWAEGVDLNYNTKALGLGNVKYYRIDEEDNRSEIPSSLRETNERSRLELRHRWDPTDRDHAILEFFRASDSTFRKDYFYREYEINTAPISYFLYSHVFPQATLSLLGQPRINKFESVIQRVPELKLETVNMRIGNTPWYYKNMTLADHLMNTVANGGVTADVSRVDSSNQISYLLNLYGIYLSPFVGHRDTFYSRGVEGKDALIRNQFFTGIDASVKFFKTYDVNTDYMHLNIHKLRHVISPGLLYNYQEEPSVNRSKLIQLDSVDAVDKKDQLTLGLENKLQTKRNGESVDLAMLLLTSDYYLEHNTTVDAGFQNVKYKLELKPYNWWELDSESEYDMRQNFLKTLTADYWMNMWKARATLGYRFKHGESSQLTTGFTCPLNPFWSAGIYERFEFKTGKMVEQEYRLERDLHCWIMEFVINQRESEGLSFFVAFRLKAFPEIGINAEKTFAPPRTP